MAKHMHGFIFVLVAVALAGDISAADVVHPASANPQAASGRKKIRAKRKRTKTNTSAGGATAPTLAVSSASVGLAKSTEAQQLMIYLNGLEGRITGWKNRLTNIPASALSQGLTEQEQKENIASLSSEVAKTEQIMQSKRKEVSRLADNSERTSVSKKLEGTAHSLAQLRADINSALGIAAVGTTPAKKTVWQKLRKKKAKTPLEKLNALTAARDTLSEGLVMGKTFGTQEKAQTQIKALRKKLASLKKLVASDHAFMVAHGKAVAQLEEQLGESGQSGSFWETSKKLPSQKEQDSFNNVKKRVKAFLTEIEAAHKNDGRGQYTEQTASKEAKAILKNIKDFQSQYNANAHLFTPALSVYNSQITVDRVKILSPSGPATEIPFSSLVEKTGMLSSNKSAADFEKIIASLKERILQIIAALDKASSACEQACTEKNVEGLEKVAVKYAKAMIEHTTVYTNIQNAKALTTKEKSTLSAKLRTANDVKNDITEKAIQHFNALVNKINTDLVSITSEEKSASETQAVANKKLTALESAYNRALAMIKKIETLKITDENKNTLTIEIPDNSLNKAPDFKTARTYVTEHRAVGASGIMHTVDVNLGVKKDAAGLKEAYNGLVARANHLLANPEGDEISALLGEMAKFKKSIVRPENALQLSATTVKNWTQNLTTQMDALKKVENPRSTPSSVATGSSRSLALSTNSSNISLPDVATTGGASGGANMTSIDHNPNAN